MKLAIVGSRDFDNYEYFKKMLEDFKFDIDEIISGGAYGVDKLAEKYAEENNIKMTVFLPDWKTYGRGAGIIRNKLIIECANHVVAFWNGVSRGTLSSINIAKKLKIPLNIIYV